MNGYLCVGGPLHGMLVTQEPGTTRFETLVMPPPTVTPDAPRAAFYQKPLKHTYELSEISPDCLIWLLKVAPMSDYLNRDVPREEPPCAD